MRDLENQIEELENEICELKEEIENFEIDPYNHEDSYCEALDCEGSVTICGMEFYPSRILQEMDPVAYRCGLLDYVDGLDNEDDEDYQNLIEKLDDLEFDLEELNEELEDDDES